MRTDDERLVTAHAVKDAARPAHTSVGARARRAMDAAGDPAGHRPGGILVWSTKGRPFTFVDSLHYDN